MIFKYTNHAKNRLIERCIPLASNSSLVIAKNRFKKMIMKSCVKTGYKNDLVYWRTEKPCVNGFIYVYVCFPVSASVYTVLTALVYDFKTLTETS